MIEVDNEFFHAEHGLPNDQINIKEKTETVKVNEGIKEESEKGSKQSGGDELELLKTENAQL